VVTRTSLLREPLPANVDARQSEASLHDSEVTGPIDAEPVVGIDADVHDEPPSEL
jgi:hypothetical protein